ncbi:ROK family protein, partial [Bacteroidota bacterium]
MPNDVAEAVAELISHFKWTGKVGCGFPTIISQGVAKSVGNIDPSWKGTNVEQLFSEKTGLEFFVANDADVAGLAEINFGIGKNKKGVVIVVTIGTGLGSSVFVNGTLVPNVELGSVPYKEYERFEYYAADSARKRDGLKFIDWGDRFNKFLLFVEQTFTPTLIILGGGASKKLHKFKSKITINVPVVAAQFENNAGIIGAAMLAN